MAENSQSGAGIMPSPEDDMSAAPQKGAPTKAEHIATLEKQHEHYRSFAFWVGGLLVLAFYIALFYYIFCDTAKAQGHERYAVMIILAAVPTALAMALMRYGFRNPIEQDDGPSPVTAIQSLLSEILEIVRSYFESRPH